MKKICNLIKNKVMCCAKKAANKLKNFLKAFVKSFFELLETVW